MEGYWEDPNRGKVPVTWGFNPLLAQFAPAVVEFFAKSATPKDSFWGWTAGYTHPSCFSPANFKLYAEETRRGLYELGISPAVDVWDSVRNTAPVYEELSTEFPHLSRHQTDERSSLAALVPRPSGSTTGRRWFAWTSASTGNRRKTGKQRPKRFSPPSRRSWRQYPGKDPKFLTINTRVSPTMVKTIQSRLAGECGDCRNAGLHRTCHRVGRGGGGAFLRRSRIG